jgi:hypothetical protein
MSMAQVRDCDNGLEQLVFCLRTLLPLTKEGVQIYQGPKDPK